jgi:hypothetical protein
LNGFSFEVFGSDTDSPSIKHLILTLDWIYYSLCRSLNFELKWLKEL